MSKSTCPSPESMSRYRAITRHGITAIPQWSSLAAEQQEAIQVVSRVLPLRTNPYVLDQLIDWDQVPDDPIFRLTLPHQDMLDEDAYRALRDLVMGGADEPRIADQVSRIRAAMNPHPAGQLSHNVPRLNGQPLPGLQHKYDQTVLFFPQAGQSCHAYCTFCFRWAQFVGAKDMTFAAPDSDGLVAYLERHPEVSDLLVTGGDPLVMTTRVLRRYLEPVLAADLPHLRTIRFGTKSVAYWPQRFVSDPDADDLLRFFESIIASGRSISVMAHYNHPRELSTAVARQAIARIRSTGAQIRMQSPMVRHVNDRPQVWADLWREGTALGMIPYYCFVERDTGPSSYFSLPLVRCWQIFRDAYRQVGGLCRTVRGPSMSAFPGKVLIDGVTTVAGERVFALQFLQARRDDWVRRPFFAAFDPHATWLDQLRPAFGAERFFFEDQLDGELQSWRSTADGVRLPQ